MSQHREGQHLHPADGGPAAAPLRVLMVCTANQCRSPMAAAIATQLASERGLPIEVSSAGMMPGGVPAARGAMRVMSRRGLDISAHRSRQLDPHIVASADLIITMEGRHVRAVAEHSFDAVERTFPLRRLATLAVAVGPRPAELSEREWLTRVTAMRAPGTALAVSDMEDIGDPMGGPARGYRRTEREIAELLDATVDLMYPDRD